MENSSGLGKLIGREIAVTERGLKLVEGHLEQFGRWPQNETMMARLQAAIIENRKVTGADACFYMHEASEATIMRRLQAARGIPEGATLDAATFEELYDEAHAAALSKYGVSPYSVYHPDVIRAFPDHFNPNWRAFWRMTP